MIKKLSFTLCFLCLFCVSTCQLHAQSLPFLGVRIGLNNTSITHSLSGHSHPLALFGLIGGVYKNFRIGRSHFSIQPELLYTRKGLKSFTYVPTKAVPLGVKVHYKLKLNYLELPVLFKYSLNRGGRINPAFLVGPYVAYSFKTILETVNSFLRVKTTKFGSQLRTFDLGWVFGGEVDFGRFNIGLRYAMGRLNLAKSDAKGKNSVISVVAGFGI